LVAWGNKDKVKTQIYLSLERIVTFLAVVDGGKTKKSRSSENKFIYQNQLLCCDDVVFQLQIN